MLMIAKDLKLTGPSFIFGDLSLDGYALVKESWMFRIAAASDSKVSKNVLFGGSSTTDGK